MQVWNSILAAREELARRQAATVVTIGNFDGVHRGHQAILGRTAALAHARQQLAVVLTFTTHTESLWGEKPFLINMPPIRRELLARQNLDGLLEVEFNQEFAAMEAEQFFRSWLVEGLRTATLVVGHDFRFGAEGRGDFKLLQQLGADHQIALEQVPPVRSGDQIISSSLIRELLAEGRIEAANQLLGYNFLIEGEVVRGEQRGRRLGYPTANLELDLEYLLPCYGVYLVQLHLNQERYFGIANVGIKPTFGQFTPLVEVYLFEVELNLYSKLVRVEFLRFIRPENRFSGPQALKSQIVRDIETAKYLLAELG